MNHLKHKEELCECDFIYISSNFKFSNKTLIR